MVRTTNRAKIPRQPKGGPWKEPKLVCYNICFGAQGEKWDISPTAAWFFSLMTFLWLVGVFLSVFPPLLGDSDSFVEFIPKINKKKPNFLCILE